MSTSRECFFIEHWTGLHKMFIYANEFFAMIPLKHLNSSCFEAIVYVDIKQDIILDFTDFEEYAEFDNIKVLMLN